MSVPFAELLDLRAPFRLRTEAFAASQADICTMGAGRARMRGDADTHANLLPERPNNLPSLPSVPRGVRWANELHQAFLAAEIL